MFKERSSGILCPIFSLPSSEGIGTLGKMSYDFVDFLSNTEQKYWQVLPIGPTSLGDSPYQSFSSFAGNPYFIDLNILVDKGFLALKDIQDLSWGDSSSIDYALLWKKKYQLLRQSFKKVSFDKNFKEKLWFQYPWLEDYARFMALKTHFSGISRTKWPEGSLKYLCSETLFLGLDDEILFHTFLQAEFYEQWTNLHNYASSKGLEIIGDLPIFVAEDSSDLWANPEIFQLDSDGLCTKVAGVPPDYFSKDGQLWGNPLYDWDYLQKNKFSWWISRIKQTFSLFDVLRIDHFRAFDAYWSIPYGSAKATSGEWVKCPGKEFFDQLFKEIGSVKIIAEDLGIITEDVKKLMNYLEFPGMKVLQFAFDDDMDNPYKPHNIEKNSIVYTGTHDNDTTVGWFLDPKNKEYRENALRYMHLNNPSPEEFTQNLIELAFTSSANTVITPIQDLLFLGTKARINKPSTIGNNWKWRMNDLPNDSLKNYLYSLMNTSNRFV